MGTSSQLLVLILIMFRHETVFSQNQVPVVSFPQNPIVPEDFPIGSALFNITATDTDTTDTLTFSTHQTATAELVRIENPLHVGDSWTATVVLKARLDQDREPNKRDLHFKVSDGSNPDIPGKVTMYIQDVNDNPPTFQHLPYRLELPERTNLTNTTVYTVSATDPDSGPGGTVTFSMTAQAQGADYIYNTTFVMENALQGHIALERELDYETRNFYQYQIFAMDRGSPPCPGPGCKCNNVTEPDVDCEGKPTTFTVTVLDVQDSPPVFERLPYITNISEDAPVNTSVYTVLASDGDRGIPNKVNYTIVNEMLYPFTMEADTGVIRVGSEGLDADNPNGRSYFITVMATEIETPGVEQYGETTATTQVAITVDDVNDNAPEFGEDIYYATVQENTPSGVPITINRTVNVTDKDQNANNLFRLSVEKDGAPYNVFTTLPSSDIQGYTTVTVSVNNSTVLDYEQVHNITFQLRATEVSTSTKNTSSTTIFLSIIDMNDNSPVFLPNQTEQVNVTEHEKNGTVLATFSATDDDSGDYGTVAYFLEDDYNGRFAIGYISGNLTVGKDIDRDGGDERFSLVVIAKDSVNGDENQRRSTRHPVTVTVLDINDNAPVFLAYIQQVAVQENAAVNTTLTTLRATDVDKGLNGEVRYQVSDVQSSNPSSTGQPRLFDIHPNTGEVYVSSSLIGHPGQYNVTFLAIDKGDQPLNDSASLIIDVKDVNVNPPVFVVPDQHLINTTLSIVPNVTIPEEEPIGTVIERVSAVDADTGRNGKVHYFLDPDLEGAFVNFAVNSSTGNLTVRARLDVDVGDKRTKYQINLRAQDQGEPLSLSSVIPFIVYVYDIDDNPPEFDPSQTLRLSAQEQTAPVVVGLVNISKDKDLDPKNHIACYYLYGRENGSLFTLNKITGELTLTTKLDRLQSPEVNITIKVTENCSLAEDHFRDNSNSYNSSDNSLLKVTVVVADINNHPPVFEKAEMTVGLLYDEPIGYEVFDLATATSDEDTPENSKHFYRLLKFQGSADSVSSAFSVSTNGSVTTRRIFSDDENVNFVLTVFVYDLDNQNDTADLTIYLVNNNQRVKLIVNQRPNEVYRIKGELVKKLGEELKMTIIADKIATHVKSEGTADPSRTDVYIHARRIPSGEVVPTSELISAFDYNQNVLTIFQEYGVAYILSVQKEEDQGDNKQLERAFIIVTLSLAIICIALAIVLYSAIRRYRRRLRAATTSAFVSTKTETQAYVPPGTNKYFTAENPLYGKDVKPADFERPEENDNDSLDDNAVGGSKPGSSDEPEEEQEIYLDVYDDDVARGAHTNHLAMVLNEYDSVQSGKLDDSSPVSLPPPYLSSSMPQDYESEPWRSSLTGLVKSDSGFSEHDAFDHDLDKLQHTDI